MVSSSNNMSPIKSALKATGVVNSKASSNVQKNIGTTDADTENPDSTNPDSTEEGSEGNASSNVDDGSVAKKLEDFKAEKQGSVDQYAEMMALQQKQQQQQQADMMKMMQQQQQADMLKNLMSNMPQLPQMGGGKPSGGGSQGGSGSQPKPQEEQKKQEFGNGSQPIEKKNTIPEKLRNSVKADAEKVHGNDPNAVSRSMSLLNEYGNKYDLSANTEKLNVATRRLAYHGVDLKDFEAVKNAAENRGRSIPEVASIAISRKNEEELSKTTEGKIALDFNRTMGFGKDQLHQITANQATENLRSFMKGYNERSEFNKLENPSPEQKAAEETRQGKQALILISDNHAEFDISGELAGLMKHKGIENIFVMQVNGEDMLKADGPIKQLADKVGGFGLLVDGGHGGKENASILFGNKSNPIAGQTTEEMRLEPHDLKEGSSIAQLYQDKDVFKEGFTHISLSCNFAGNDKIDQKDSMQAAFQDLRKDANIYGPKGEVPSFASFSTNSNGQLEHSNIDQPLALLSDANFDATSRSEDNFENLELSFPEDDEDLEFNFADI